MIDLNAIAHSKAQLEVTHHQEGLQVKKTFHGDVERALKNIRKQRNFKAISSGNINISAAPVLSVERHDDLLNVSMPYIEGVAGDAYALLGTPSVVATLSSALSLLVFLELSESRVANVDSEVFKDKFEQTLDATDDREMVKALESCGRFIASLPARIEMPLGACHGDLTLGNMILSQSEGLVLIDFLDTYLESPLQDVGKLLQEFRYGWSFRKTMRPLQIKGRIFLNRTLPFAASQLCNMYPVASRVVEFLTLARIAPYIKDEETCRWLHESLRVFNKSQCNLTISS